MYMHGYMHGGPPHGEGMQFLFLFGLGRLLWLAILILLVCLLVRRLSRRGPRWRSFMNAWGPSGPPPWQGANVPHPPYPGPGTSHEPPSALEILNRRYASGEIDAEAFEHMRERILASQRPNQE